MTEIGVLEGHIIINTYNDITNQARTFMFSTSLIPYKIIDDKRKELEELLND